MNKNAKWLVLLFTIFAATLYAGVVRADDFQIPPKPDNGWYIADTAGVLSIPDKAILNHKLDVINKTSRNEIGIALVATLNGSSVEDAAQDTFHQWGIGKVGLDNGVLIFIATKDRKIRIQTGNGAEGDLPDSVCNQIILDSKPYYRKGDWAGGLSYDIDQLSAKMESRVGQNPIVPPTKKPATSNGSAGWTFLGVLGVLGLVGFFMWWASRRKEHRWPYMDNTAPYRPASHASPATPQSYSVPDPYHVATRRTVGTHPVRATAVAVGVAATLTLAEKRRRQAQADTERANRDAARRKKREDDDTSSSSSSSSGGYSYDSSSDIGGGGGGYDGGGGFGGGDSGGGGASGDF